MAIWMCSNWGTLMRKRGWGFAGDYVEGMWLILQQDEAQDFVLATGENHTVRSFAETAASRLGFDIEWLVSGADEQGRDRRSGKTIVRVSPQFHRLAEVDRKRSGTPTLRGLTVMG